MTMEHHRNATGVVAPEARADYSRSTLSQFCPAGSTGKEPKCTTNCLVPGATFKSIRPQYSSDPDFARVGPRLRLSRLRFHLSPILGAVRCRAVECFWGHVRDSSSTATPRHQRNDTPTATRTNTPARRHSSHRQHTRATTAFQLQRGHTPTGLAPYTDSQAVPLPNTLTVPITVAHGDAHAHT